MMPELPEVEVVRAGLVPALSLSTAISVEVRDVRSLKRHSPDLGRFEELITGATFATPVRRGKFLWVPIESATGRSTQPLALLAHLGMSGQMLVRDESQTDDRHVRIRIWVEHPTRPALRIDFADQRIFGSLAIDQLIPTDDGLPGGLGTEKPLIPRQVAHISRDLLDPGFSEDRFVLKIRQRSSGVKRVLLDQRMVSGIGNIYADEALWAAKVHPETPARELTSESVHSLLAEARVVLQKALAEGGTSFDAQYVNVNGQAGYFEHSLNAYGRHGKPCSRCGAVLVRAPFMNRKSHFCPECQIK